MAGRVQQSTGQNSREPRELSLNPGWCQSPEDPSREHLTSGVWEVTSMLPRVPRYSQDTATHGRRRRMDTTAWLTKCQGQGRASKMGSLVPAAVWE